MCNRWISGIFIRTWQDNPFLIISLSQLSWKNLWLRYIDGIIVTQIRIVPMISNLSKCSIFVNIQHKNLESNDSQFNVDTIRMEPFLNSHAYRFHYLSQGFNGNYGYLNLSDRLVVDPLFNGLVKCVCESTKSTVEDFIQIKSNKIVKTGILTGSRLVWVFNSGCKSFFNLIREPVFYYLMIFHNGSNDKPVKYSNISLKLFELDLYYLMVIHWLYYWLRIHFWCN